MDYVLFFFILKSQLLSTPLHRPPSPHTSYLSYSVVYFQKYTCYIRALHLLLLKENLKLFPPSFTWLMLSFFLFFFASSFGLVSQEQEMSFRRCHLNEMGFVKNYSHEFLVRLRFDVGISHSFM